MLILPYIEQQRLHDQYRFDEPWDGPHNCTLANRMPKILAFHGTESPTTVTNYVAVVGAETMWPGPVGRKGDEITDGTSDTILVVENNDLGIHWMEPRDLAFDSMDFRLDSPAGVSSWYEHPAVVMVDGSVRRLTNTMSPEALRASLTARGGEKLSDEGNGWSVLEDGRLREKAVTPRPAPGR